MEAQHFLGLEPVDDTLHWRMEVRSDLATPEGFLFGGCGLGAAVVALEAAAERPLICTSGQFLSYASRGSVVEWEVALAVVGHHMTYGRAVARADGREVLNVTAALGAAEPDVTGIWADRPEVPGPDECPHRSLPATFRNSILDRIEVRAARGRHFEEVDGSPGPPDSALWIRLPEHHMLSAATLAIIGDYIPHAASQPIGRRVIARSLDNTLRIVQLRPSEWVLCDIRILAVTGGYGQGTAIIWSDEGELLATANQSFRARLSLDDAFLS
ncbi:MAG: acyl-CoA thioesterase [Acidimicrobiales bacterium]